MSAAMYRILYVDDDGDLRFLVQHQLTEAGHAVITAEDGERAIEIIDGESFDLILLDIKMPRKNGLDVLKYLKAKATRPRVIMLTGVEDVSVAIKAVKLGANDYITKPYRMETLLECMHRVLAR